MSQTCQHMCRRCTCIALLLAFIAQLSAVLPRECIKLVQELGGEVEYIILSTFAYEHKIYVPPFNRAFKGAQVWVAPG